MSLAKIFIATVVVVLIGAGGGFAAHPGSDASCDKCHKSGTSGDAPKVTPEDPGFVERMFQGKQSYKGHNSVSCTGTVSQDGKVTGCHAPEKGFRNHLVMDLKDKPTDTLCANCHPNASKFGLHHPSYQMDKNGDGVGDKFVRPVAVQEIFTEFSPANKSLPVKKYPDSILFVTRPDGVRVREVALPLEKATEQVGDKVVVYDDIVGCTTCHNPHYGYLVEIGKEEDIKAGQVARTKGDSLLRLRDYDNALCVACH